MAVAVCIIFYIFTYIYAQQFLSEPISKSYPQLSCEPYDTEIHQNTRRRPLVVWLNTFSLSFRPIST